MTISGVRVNTLFVLSYRVVVRLFSRQMRGPAESVGGVRIGSPVYSLVDAQGAQPSSIQAA